MLKVASIGTNDSRNLVLSSDWNYYVQKRYIHPVTKNVLKETHKHIFPPFIKEKYSQMEFHLISLNKYSHNINFL